MSRGNGEIHPKLRRTITIASNFGGGVSSPMPHAERQVRRFGRFMLEPDAGTLSRDGTVIPLRPKSFAVLWHLSDHAGRVVSKEELLAKEWPVCHRGRGFACPMHRRDLARRRPRSVKPR